MDSCGHRIMLHSGSDPVLDPAQFRKRLLALFGITCDSRISDMVQVSSYSKGGLIITVDPLLADLDCIKETVGTLVLEHPIDWIFVQPDQPFRRTKPLTATIYEMTQADGLRL